VGLLGGVEAGDPEASTINAKKCRRRSSWEVSELDIQERPPSILRNVDGGPPQEVLELEIREHLPSTLRNIDAGPLGDARAGDPEATTINAKKCR
jgi:hypothetical protein